MLPDLSPCVSVCLSVFLLLIYLLLSSVFLCLDEFSPSVLTFSHRFYHKWGSFIFISSLCDLRSNGVYFTGLSGEQSWK